MFNYKYALSAALIAVLSVFSIGCKKPEANKTTISVKGSDTMVNLSQKWAETYMNGHPDVSIQVTGGGSGTGIAALLNNTTNIANSSRDIKDKEKESALSRNIVPRQFEVALDGIAVIVNPSNKVESLSIKQLSDIFSGKIKNWKELGGVDSEIVLYGRENSSGTYEFFKEHVLGKDESGEVIDYAITTQVLQGTASLGEAVARDVKGIGYGGVGYFALRNDVKVLPIKKDDASPAVSPVTNKKVNYEAIWKKEYPISRYLYCYTNGEPQGSVKEFMDFILSDEGQKVVETMEYIPLPDNK